ncbi:MAG: hypothetical protein PHN75_20160 [Syntrophales bacterium]|nr:hypothetical protein [Syntrophales bacterium]
MTAKDTTLPTGVFSEIRETEAPSQTTVNLTIKAAIKRPAEGYFLFEPERSPRDKEGYAFELNIDGQEIIWKIPGNEETTSSYTESGQRIPEGGTGIRYELNKTVQLKPGPHHVVFGLPQDDYFTEIKISLEEGKSHTVEFMPTYSMGRKGFRTFNHGIRTFRIFLDGKQIR